MAVILPLVDPFVFSGRTYRDIRALSPEENVQAAVYLQMALAGVVFELQCDSAIRPLPPPGREEFDLTTEELVADIFPINCAAFEAGVCVDAFGIYAVNRLNQSTLNWRVSARLLPGFIDSYDDHQRHVLAVSELLGFLADTRLSLEDGSGITFADMGVAIFWKPGGGPADERAEALHTELIGRRDNPNSRQNHTREDYPGKSGWHRHRVSKRNGGP